MLKLISQNNKYYNLCKIVMLPTNENAVYLDMHKGILKCKNPSLELFNKLYLHKANAGYGCENWVAQHLYGLSDEEITVGCWYYFESERESFVRQCKSIDRTKEYWLDGNIKGGIILKKVIITTDNSLGIITGDKLIDPSTNTKELIGELLPKFTNDFLNNYVEKFNNGITISNVLVEYECDSEDYNNWNPPYPNRPLDEQKVYKLKVDSKDNTIPVKVQKDSLNKEEIVELMKKFVDKYTCHDWYDIYNDWLEYNI